MSFSVRFVESEAQIDAQLWDVCFPPPLEGRWWYATLERAGLEEQFSFRYGLISRDGVPVGIAPAFVMDFPVGRVAPPCAVRRDRAPGENSPAARQAAHALRWLAVRL